MLVSIKTIFYHDFFLMEDQLIIHSTNIYLIHAVCQALLEAKGHKIEEDMVSAVEKLIAMELGRYVH